MQITTSGRTHAAAFSLSLTALLLLIAPPPARAHEYWLMPSTYRPAPVDTVQIRACVGTGFRGESKGWNAARCVGFRLLGPTPRNLAGAAADNDSIWARITLPDDQGALVAYVSNFATIELPAAQFDAYLQLEGLSGPLAERRKAGAAEGVGRERYRRCPKTWIAGRGAAPSAGPTGAPARYAQTLGQPIELTPLSDPGRNGPVTFRLDFDGEPLAGALVRAWRRPLRSGAVGFAVAERDSVPPLLEVRTNARGEASLKLAGRGEYLVSAVQMVMSQNRAMADWESNWASYTFARP